MNVSRRDFFSIFGIGAAAAALPGCVCVPPGKAIAKIALQLYSIREYIGGKKDKDGKILVSGAGLAKAFAAISAIGYKGVEFAGYYDNDAKTLKAMLDDNGLVACGTHVARKLLGPEKIAETCDFNLGYGNNLIICPGSGNMPAGCAWDAGRDNDKVVVMNQEQEDFVKMLVDYYNKAAADAAKYGCRIGIHNHTWEHATLFRDGTSYWDYFFGNTDPSVCMEQDVGWSTCAGVNPCDQYAKYPHRSPTLHAKENGMGKGVTSFDAILGRPGKPGATPVDWDSLIPATEKDGVEWYVVECERHFDDLSAVLPSYNFLKSKGLN